MHEKVFFKNSKGIRLAGIVDRDPDKMVQPAILILGAFNSYKYSAIQEELVTYLKSLGFATLRFDYQGRGESEGDISYATFSSGLEDTKAAFKFLKNQLWSDTENIGMYASGIGSSFAVYETTRKKGCKFMILVNPRLDIQSFFQKADIEDWRENEFYHTRGLNYHISIYDDAIKYNALERAERVKIPTLVIDSVDEETYLLNCHKKIKKAIKHADIKIIEGKNRTFSPENLEELSAITKEWLEKNA